MIYVLLFDFYGSILIKVSHDGDYSVKVVFSRSVCLKLDVVMYWIWLR
jgi:hypothetical protein